MSNQWKTNTQLSTTEDNEKARKHEEMSGERKDMENRAGNTGKKQGRHIEFLANATSSFAAHVNRASGRGRSRGRCEQGQLPARTGLLAL